jgi:hypothetical protein
MPIHNIEYFEAEEQQEGNKVITFNGQTMNNRSADEQVCIYDYSGRSLWVIWNDACNGE